MGPGTVKSEEGALEKENVAVPVPVPAFSESKEEKVVLQHGAANCKGILPTPLSGVKEEDLVVNIIGSGCVVSGGKGVEGASDDATDTECSSSSSFGDTGSAIEDASDSAFTDGEVESPMCDDWTTTNCPVKKNKATTIHWRRFIHPIRWRCKWIELQLKKLNSLAQKYDKELAEYDYKRQLEFSKFTLDDFNVKSVPISDAIRMNKVMKRKKRNKVEESDLSSYVSNHSLFSYYENKSHNHDASLEEIRDDALRGNTDNIEELKLIDTWPSVDLEDNDKAFRDLLQKIDELRSQVEKLRTRVDNVVSENPGKFCSVTQLSMIGPSDGFNHSGHNSASFAGNENTFPASFVCASSQDMSELKTDLLLTENTLSTHEGLTSFIETTNWPQLDVLQENTKDEILIQNQAAKEELYDFESVKNQFVEKTKESVEEQKSIPTTEVSESDQSDMVADNAVPTLKACSTSKSIFCRNAKKGRKRSSMKRWKRRQSG